MSRIALLLLDVNGVLYDYDKAVRVAHLARRAGAAPEAVERAIWHSGLEDRGDAGALDADGYLRAFGDGLDTTLTEAEWMAALAASLRPAGEMLALVARAARRVRLGVLTNNNLLVRRHFAALYPAVAALPGDAIFASAELGARKPEPEVYRRALHRLGAAPETCLFIDDSGANVAGAERAGLIGHHHTGIATTAARLAEAGLL